MSFLGHLIGSSELKTLQVGVAAHMQTGEPRAGSVCPFQEVKLPVIGEIVAPVKDVAFTVYNKL